MSNSKYLIQGIKPYQYFYFRCIIPKDLRDILGKSQIRISLKSSDYCYSKNIANTLYSLAQSIFEDFRIGKMKKKLYTLAHDNNLLNEIDNNGSIFTAEEHSYLMEKEFSKTIFKSREHFIRYFLNDACKEMVSLEFIHNLVINNNYQNILSLGSGVGLYEYLLKMSLPETSQVVSTDFDSFLIKKSKEFLPEIIAEQFDFLKDDIVSFPNKLNIQFDLAIFTSSSYVMDDKEFIKLFGDLKTIGVKKIIDIHAGYLNLWDVIKHVRNDYLIPKVLRTNYYVRKILQKPSLINTTNIGTVEGRNSEENTSSIPPGNYRGKFHGYCRSRGEIRKLYKMSGLKFKKNYLLIIINILLYSNNYI